MSPLRVPNFSPIRARVRVLWRSVRNEEEKNEEIETKFCSLVSRKWLKRLSSNLVCSIGGRDGGPGGPWPVWPPHFLGHRLQEKIEIL